MEETTQRLYLDSPEALSERPVQLPERDLLARLSPPAPVQCDPAGRRPPPVPVVPARRRHREVAATVGWAALPARDAEHLQMKSNPLIIFYAIVYLAGLTRSGCPVWTLMMLESVSRHSWSGLLSSLAAITSLAWAASQRST